VNRSSLATVAAAIAAVKAAVVAAAEGTVANAAAANASVAVMKFLRKTEALTAADFARVVAREACLKQGILRAAYVAVLMKYRLRGCRLRKSSCLECFRGKGLC
jgi:hypothetical protein